MAIDKVTAASFLRLGSPDFAPFIAYLQRERDAAYEAMGRTESAEQWRRLQGRASLACELLTLVADAPATMARIEESILASRE